MARSPRIAVRVLLEDRGLLENLVRIADRYPHREVRAGVKRWIDVDEVDLSGVVLKEAAHHELVVTPDELVPLIVRDGCRTE